MLPVDCTESQAGLVGGGRPAELTPLLSLRLTHNPITQTPSPQELKAALDDAIASLARHPDLAAALWERLGAAVVVAPAAAGEAASVPRYDLTYQINEIEVKRGCWGAGCFEELLLPAAVWVTVAVAAWLQALACLSTAALALLPSPSSLPPSSSGPRRGLLRVCGLRPPA